MSESPLASRIALVAEGSDPAPLDWLRQRMRVLEMRASDPEFPATLACASALLVRTYTKVNEALLAGAPLLKVVGRGGVGLENIDVNACRRRGIEVVYTPDANTLAVGDYVVGAMLQLLRPWASFSQSAIAPAEFKRIRDTIRGQQLNELTLGILGMGRVGRRVGQIAASGFGMRVLYNDLPGIAGKLDYPAEAVEKDRLYREADVLTIHVDMRPGNAHLVAGPQLALMKQGALLINCSRGEVLDAGALAEALRAGRLMGAALDVFAPEPPMANFPLIGLKNVLLTPHIAARTYTAMENMSWVVRDLVAVLEGRPPQYPAP